MRSLAHSFPVVVLTLAAFGPFLAAQEVKPLKAGDPLPGAFQVLMVTGDRAGNFHCPVCEFDLRPAVLVFVHDVDDINPTLEGFLKKLDALIAKHPKSRIGATVVFLNDGDYRKLLQNQINNSAKVAELELTKAILVKEEKEAKIKALAKAAKLQNVTLGLGSSEELKNYKLDDKAAVTVLFYDKQQVVSVASFPKDKLTDQDADKILKEVDQNATDFEKSLRARR